MAIFLNNFSFFFYWTFKYEYYLLPECHIPCLCIAQFETAYSGVDTNPPSGRWKSWGGTLGLSLQCFQVLFNLGWLTSRSQILFANEKDISKYETSLILKHPWPPVPPPQFQLESIRPTYLRLNWKSFQYNCLNQIQSQQITLYIEIWYLEQYYLKKTKKNI